MTHRGANTDMGLGVCKQNIKLPGSTFEMVTGSRPITWNPKLVSASTFTRLTVRSAAATQSSSHFITDNKHMWSSSAAEMGDRLAPIDMGRKVGADVALPFFGGGLGLYLTQCPLDGGLPPYQVSSWSIQPFGHNRHGPKIWGCVPFWVAEAECHLKQCGRGRGLTPCQVSSWSIQPLGHKHQRYRQTGRTTVQNIWFGLVLKTWPTFSSDHGINSSLKRARCDRPELRSVS